MKGPLVLIAELTHRCPLHCVYCSNPLELKTRETELSTATWQRVFREAAELGVKQLSLTGGEPLARPDLLELVKTGNQEKLYTNLITSGIGVDEKKLAALESAGLDHIQLSIQDADEKSANQIAGTKAHQHKLKTAKLIKKFKFAFTVNMVLHRQNLDRLEKMIELAEELGVDRLEIAHTQYYGWAFKNRDFLLPTREQLDRSIKIVEAAQERLKGKIKITFVVPDYYARFPKPCMGGWGAQTLLIDPQGKVLPCHAADLLPGLDFENVADQSLRSIWEDSPSFNAYRGDDWMTEPCRSCERKAKDFGGCRCQAFLLTGKAEATDPVCSLSPQHSAIESALTSVTEPVESPAWIHRG